MPYSVPRNPAPLDKSKNFPGIDTSEITMRTRIITVGSFVSNNNILNTQKSLQQAYQAIRSTNQGNVFQQTALTRSLLANTESVPSSPTDLTTSITNISSTNCDCTVSWSAPGSGGDTITGYTITGSPGTLSGTTVPSIRTFTFTGLLVNTLYTFTVTASNRAGPSFPATVTVTTPTIPSSPTNLATSITNITSSNCDCTVSWSVPSSNGGDAITGYSITGSPGTLSGTTVPSIRTFTFTGLSLNTLYTFTVSASNRAGPSFPVTVTVTTPTIPSSPTNLATSIANITSSNCDCTVSWSVPSSNGGAAITGYSITGSPGTLSGTTDRLTRTFTFTGLSLNTLYTFTVRATNIIGNSVPATVTVTTPTIPSSPTNLATSINTDSVTYINCTVSWSVPSSNGGAAITGYSITGSPDNLSGTTVPSIRTFTFTGLSSDTLYTFTVRATNIIGNSVLATVTVTTPVVLDVPSINITGSNLAITQTSPIASRRWTTQITGIQQIGNESVNKDSNGNVIICGYFSSTLTAYNKNGTPFATTLSTNNPFNVFLVQYSSTGSVNWVAKVGGPNIYESCVIIDSSGNVNIYGFFTETATAYNSNTTPFTRTLTSVGGYDGYIFQYSSTGSVNWVAQIGGISGDTPSTTTAIVDSSGNVTFGGYFYSPTLTAYNSSGSPFVTTLTYAGGYYDVFIVQYSSTGSVNWIAKIAGTGYEYPARITRDLSGNITIEGTFDSPTLTAYDKNNTPFGTTLSAIGDSSGFRATYTLTGYVTALIRN